MQFHSAFNNARADRARAIRWEKILLSYCGISITYNAPYALLRLSNISCRKCFFDVYSFGCLCGSIRAAVYGRRHMLGMQIICELNLIALFSRAQLNLRIWMASHGKLSFGDIFSCCASRRWFQVLIEKSCNKLRVKTIKINWKVAASTSATATMLALEALIKKNSLCSGNIKSRARIKILIMT